MKFFAIFLSILVFAAGIVFGKINNFGTNFAGKNTDPFIDASNKVENPVAEDVSDTLQITPSISLVSTISPSPVQSDEFINFRYPDSEIVKDNGGQIVLTSSGDTEKIVDWYKKQIEAKNYNLNNFIVTKTNGNEVDKLSATGEGGNVLVEIVKERDSTNTSITVSIK